MSSAKTRTETMVLLLHFSQWPSSWSDSIGAMWSHLSVMQMAGHTLSATESAIRSSMVAKPSASHTLMSFDAFMERTIADMYSSSLPGPQELGCWMAGRRYDRD